MATIRDVAGLAGVSISTVSLALNAPDRVSPETRARVAEAARAVGFSANPIAQSLKRGRARLIGMVVAGLANPFFGRVLSEVVRCASEADYLLVVTETDASPETERAILRHLTGQRAAGIILSSTGRGGDTVDFLSALPMPLVQFDHRLPGLAADWVGTDNELASAMLTEHLIRLGHRRIALIGGTTGLYTAVMRQRGYEQTLRAHGIAPDPGLIVDGRYDWQGGYDAAMRLMTMPTGRPTAMIAASNVLAVGALQACNELAIDCPGEVSLVGIDDLPWSAVIRPRITAAVQPVEEMSREVIRLLLERIDAPPGAESAPRAAVFAPRLIPGESTAPPPA